MWLSFFHTPSPRAWAKPRRRAATRSRRPILEELELRLVPTSQTFNPGDTASLIQDLQAASNNPNVTTIINLQLGANYIVSDVNNFWYGPDGLPPIDSNVIIHGNQLQTEIDNDPMFNSSAGQMAVLRGETAALDSLGPR